MASDVNPCFHLQIVQLPSGQIVGDLEIEVAGIKDIIVIGKLRLRAVVQRTVGVGRARGVNGITPGDRRGELEEVFVIRHTNCAV